MRLISFLFLSLTVINLSCKKNAVGSKASSPNIDLAIEGKPLREILRNIHEYEDEEFTLVGTIHATASGPLEAFQREGKGKFKKYFQQEDRCILICSEEEIDSNATEITIKVERVKNGFSFTVVKP